MANPIQFPGYGGDAHQPLWPGLLSTAIYNLNRQQSRVRLFEAGQCFIPMGNEEIVRSLPESCFGLICGFVDAEPDGLAVKRKWIFIDVKADLEAFKTGCLKNFLSVKKPSIPHCIQGSSLKFQMVKELVRLVGRVTPKNYKKARYQRAGLYIQVNVLNDR